MSAEKFSDIALLCAVCAGLGVWCSATCSGQEDLPNLREMREFCERLLEVPQAEEPLPEAADSSLFQALKFEDRKRIEKIRSEEEENLLEAAKSLDRLAPGEKFRRLIQLGLFEQALEVLSASGLRGKGQESADYYVHLENLYRWTGNHAESEKAGKKAQELFEAASRTKKKGQKEAAGSSEGSEAREWYEKKFFHRLFPKLREYRESVEKSPGKAENWRQLAGYSAQLGYRLDEVCARRVLFQAAWKEGKFPAQEAKDLGQAYLLTEQPKRVLELTRAALDAGMKNPEVYLFRIKAYLMAGDEEGAQAECRNCRQATSEMPNLQRVRQALREEMNARW